MVNLKTDWWLYCSSSYYF